MSIVIMLKIRVDGISYYKCRVLVLFKNYSETCTNYQTLGKQGDGSLASRLMFRKNKNRLAFLKEAHEQLSYRRKHGSNYPAATLAAQRSSPPLRFTL